MSKSYCDRSSQVNAVTCWLRQYVVVAIAMYLCNCMVPKTLKIGETPYLLWYGEKPNLKHIRVFGCVVYTHIYPRQEPEKIRQGSTEIKVHWLHCNIYQLQSLGQSKAQMLRSS